jgi:hypothetical protein
LLLQIFSPRPLTFLYDPFNFEVSHWAQFIRAIWHIKVPLKAKIVQILFSQIHKHYGMCTFQTFTVDGITVAYQIESMAWVRMKKWEYFSKNLRNTFRHLGCNQCCRNNILTINEVQVSFEYSIIGCLSRPQVFFENESTKKCYFCYHYLFTRVVREITALQRVSRSNLHFTDCQI